MVLVLDVAKLMNNDIINQGKGQFNGVMIENNFIVGGALPQSLDNLRNPTTRLQGMGSQG